MIHLVAGGPIDHLPDLQRVAGEDPAAFWVGVDAGTKRLFDAGIVPKVAFGDFDSVSREDRAAFQEQMPNLQIFPSEKDETDLEIALKWAIANTNEAITIFGATGGRLDHEMAAIQLISDYVEKRTIWLVDRQNELTVLMPGQYQFEVSSKKYISFLSLSDKLENVTQSGFKYNLIGREVSRASTLGVSNEIVGQAGHISFEKGICLVVRSED